MNVRRPAALVLATLTAATLLASCASPQAAAPVTTDAAEADSAEAGHGEIEGAAEVSEPPLALVSIDASGAVGMLDLLTGDEAEVGALDAPTALSTDGRYGFVTTYAGLAVVDSGRWSWDHGDHFHYYEAPAAILGTVPGEGAATVTAGALSTAGSTGVFFEGSGEAVLLDNAALSDGELTEAFRVDVDATGGVVAPLSAGALVADGDELVYLDSVGAATGDAIACVDASGAITTRVGLVVGCADGAVLATWQGGSPVFERIAYPAGVDAERALAFDGRKGRPTVAALAGSTGYWLLDTRALAWTYAATEVPLVRVVAADDADGNVVGLDADGRVHVFADGVETGVSDPLVGAVTDRVALTVDGQRAYLNDPDAGVVHEIDDADGARVARTLTPPTGAEFVMEVGR